MQYEEDLKTTLTNLLTTHKAGDKDKSPIEVEGKSKGKAPNKDAADDEDVD